MTRRFRVLAILSLVGFLALGSVFAQQRRRGGGGGGRFGGDRFVDITQDRRGVEEWKIDPQFKSDTFTFARVQYSGGSWSTDYPDSDLNFSIRLQQLTSLKVNPWPVIVQLTDDSLFDYPFLYMLEIRNLYFQEDEVVALRRYLLNGGFLMVDDFWGVGALENIKSELRRVFPDRQAVELPLEHPIFHCVYDLKEKPQVPGIQDARYNRGTDRTDEGDSGPANYYGIFDDHGRMMVILCQNTDLGDGWEREGEEEWYFHEFSEKKAYPMGINIVFYAMTH